MNHLTVHYDPVNGIAVADGLAENYVESIVDSLRFESVTLTVGSDLIVTFIRLAIGEGKIHHELVTFVFDGQEIKFGPTGSIMYPSRWPEGFCDYHLKIFAKMSKIRRAKP